MQAVQRITTPSTKEPNARARICDGFIASRMIGAEECSDPGSRDAIAHEKPPVRDAVMAPVEAEAAALHEDLDARKRHEIGKAELDDGEFQPLQAASSA
jgi:hypothetical protein